MAHSIQQIIDETKAERFDERLVDFEGSYRFDIEGVGSYLVEVDHGRVAARPSSDPADCVITASPDDFVRIMEGEQNLLTAFLQGRVGFQGDLAVAMVVHRLLPAHPREEGREVRP
jgi:putative sterol carrier protein